MRSILHSAKVAIANALNLHPTLASHVAKGAGDGTGVLDFVRPETVAAIQSHLLNPRVLFQMQFARQVVARDRAEKLISRGVAKARETEAVAFNSLEYNLAGASSAPMLDRPMLMTNVVSSIGWVQNKIGDLDVLSIGPRSEIELFGMIAAGFSQSRIKALDLFSYSPLVEAGDMHAMPYPDNSFDVVFSSWVLPYSKDHKRAAAEMVRVARNKAIISVAADYGTVPAELFHGETSLVQSCDQILSLFGDRVRKVFFKHEAEMPSVAMVATVFEIAKS